MIGVRVGVAVGVNVGPAVGVSADDVGGSWSGNSIVALGNSNLTGQGIGEAVQADGEFDSAFAVLTPIGGPYNKHFSQASSDPVPYLPDINGQVGPYAAAGVQNSGWQVPFAQELARAGYIAALWEHSIGGIKALQFAPAANFPTLPGGTQNLWNASLSRFDGLGGRVKSMLNELGGNDGFTAPDATAYQGNQTAIINAGITKWGSGLVIPMVRQPVFQTIGGTVPQYATIVAAQDAVAAAFPSNVALVFTDDLTGHSDHLHFDGNSYVILGQRLAYAMLDKLGVARVRPSTFPQIMGWAPLYTGTGALSVIGPGCAIDKDLEVVTVFSQTASGANAAISTPTTTGAQPWTSRGTATSTDGTSTTRMAIFTRPVTAADLVTGHGNMPASTVPANGNPINGARIFVVRGPNAGSTPSVDVIQTSVNNAFQTGLTLAAPANTTAANELILAIAGGYRTNASANPVAIAFTNPTNPLFVVGSNRTVVVDRITHAAWAAQLAAAGAIGGTTATFALATLACGAVIGIKP